MEICVILTGRDEIERLHHFKRPKAMLTNSPSTEAFLPSHEESLSTINHAKDEPL
ncbi:hypothetical protein PENVUL_c019G02425 [Penicillium vulpinum]|uniref:Uncharacterized protein n=1 Tax=Penicillium vulpinum TaxID=29845 RepID=A0A1V6RXQ9_9EURO|nr:hypothetical protein PENVUL_c019G02425 [Penicillium vulpinum]